MVISITVPIASFMKSAQKSDGGLSDVRKLLLRPIVILSSCDLGAVIVQEQPGRSLVRSIRPLVTDFYQTYHGRCVVVRRLLNIYVLNTARVVLS